VSIELTHLDGVATLVLRGEIDRSTTVELQASLLELLAATRAVLDLRDATWLDQAAVDSVLAAYRLRNLMGSPLTLLHGEARMASRLEQPAVVASAPDERRRPRVVRWLGGIGWRRSAATTMFGLAVLVIHEFVEKA
jgi:anti-anti-sigma regulatory factor